MMNITTVHSTDTEYSADSIEWCPDMGYRCYFACGTYQLEGDNSESSSPPCRRKGRIYLFKFDATIKELSELFRLDTAAILDMKWLPQSHHKPTLATANALGQIEVYKLENDKLILHSSLDLNIEFHNLLALSLDWNWQTNQVCNQNARQILVSDSTGAVSLVDYTEENGLRKIKSWSAHNFEAWICAFDKWDTNLVYTGGDDTYLHVHDLRSYERVLTNKNHIAGVTCLLSHPKYSNILITGSYDERLRSFDTRNMKQPLGEINLGGGVWRLKPDPLNRNLILAACMYKNFSVVQFENGNFNSPKLVGEYNEHKSICYGADWCQDVEKTSELYIATCSFYDHKLCIANVKEQ